jgi:hypothetical protein
MVIPAVKANLASRWGTLLLVTAAILAICIAGTGVLPRDLVEAWYSRGIFPRISRLLALLAGGLPFSWMDLVLPSSLAMAGWAIFRRRLRYLVALPAAGYLFFFLTWGLNYQRMPLVSKLDFLAERVDGDAVRRLREEVAAELNSLYSEKEAARLDDDSMVREAGLRVASVVQELDGVRFPVPAVKTSWILNPLFRAGGTAGMFNPFGHEALVTEPLLEVERPLIVMHEIAHVMGYANEGEANFVAFLAAIHSPQPLIRYSGWLYLWLYLRSGNSDAMLDEGPLADLRTIYERRREEEVEWVSRAGDRTLDTFLRANRVRGGVRSYSELVELAVGTRPSWNRFAPPAAAD